jgi:hypothetical protein
MSEHDEMREDEREWEKAELEGELQRFMDELELALRKCDELEAKLDHYRALVGSLKKALNNFED